jgi:hypothetical protein
VAQPYNGVLGNKNKSVLTHTAYSENYTEKIVPKGYVLYGYIYIPSKWQNYGSKDEINGYQGVGTQGIYDHKWVAWRSSFVVTQQFCVLIVTVVQWIYKCDKTS